MLAQSTAPEETRFLELKPFSDEMIVSICLLYTSPSPRD